jgi:hypothetical protein
MSVFQKLGWQKLGNVQRYGAIALSTIATFGYSSLQFSALAVATPKPSVLAQATLPTGSTMADGVYLYGQSQKPNELGQAYFVFEVKQGNVMGALYMPQSSFDCATGQFQQRNLALKVRDTYDKTVSPYTIATTQTTKVASQQTTAVPVGLEGFHRLDRVSPNDLRLLQTCRQVYQAKG